MNNKMLKQMKYRAISRIQEEEGKRIQLVDAPLTVAATDLLELINEIERLRKRNQKLMDSRYTPLEVARWLDAYKGKFREKPMTVWVQEYRASQDTSKPSENPDLG